MNETLSYKVTRYGIELPDEQKSDARAYAIAEVLHAHHDELEKAITHHEKVMLQRLKMQIIEMGKGKP